MNRMVKVCLIIPAYQFQAMSSRDQTPSTKLMEAYISPPRSVCSTYVQLCYLYNGTKKNETTLAGVVYKPVDSYKGGIKRQQRMIRFASLLMPPQDTQREGSRKVGSNATRVSVLRPNLQTGKEEAAGN